MLGDNRVGEGKSQDMSKKTEAQINLNGQI